MVSSIGSAYNSALDFIDVTCNWEDVSHIQYKCERCESTNQFAAALPCSSPRCSVFYFENWVVLVWTPEDELHFSKRC